MSLFFWWREVGDNCVDRKTFARINHFFLLLTLLTLSYAEGLGLDLKELAVIFMTMAFKVMIQYLTYFYLLVLLINIQI